MLGDGPGIFPICPFRSTHEEQSRKGPRHNLDLSRKKWETPRFGNPPGLASPNWRTASPAVPSLLGKGFRGVQQDRGAIPENIVQQPIAIPCSAIVMGAQRGVQFYFIFAVLQALFSCSEMSFFYLKTCTSLKEPPEAPLDWHLKTTHPNKSTVCANNLRKICTNCTSSSLKKQGESRQKEFPQSVSANSCYSCGWFFGGGLPSLEIGGSK